MRTDRFTFRGDEFAYFDHPYNTTALNERAVEVPIARAFIARYGLDVEVGAVLGHYGHEGHRVIDRYEEGAEAIDVLDLATEPRTELRPLGSVVSISTLEHVRWDRPEPRDPNGAVAALNLLMDRAAHLLVTIPLGHHPRLDGLLMDGHYGGSTLVRAAAGGWVETAELTWRPYGASTKWADAVWIGPS